MTVEGVRTRASTSEALLTLAVPLEQASLISAFLSHIGEQVGVAFADTSGEPLVQEKESGWSKLPPLTQSAISIAKEKNFQNFIAAITDGHPSLRLATEGECADYIRDFCKVGSRKELETVDGARERFGALMAEYRAWLKK